MQLVFHPKAHRESRRKRRSRFKRRRQQRLPLSKNEN